MGISPPISPVADDRKQTAEKARDERVERLADAMEQGYRAGRRYRGQPKPKET